MPVFEYAGLNERGKKTTGIIDADSAYAARQKLRASAIYPSAIKEVHEAATLKKQPGGFSWRLLFGRVKAVEVSMMTRQLATLAGTGFPLVSAIDALIPQTRSTPLKKTLAKIKDTIVEGSSFAQALSLFPKTFSSLFINMVRAGESSGTLEIVLKRLADIMESQQALKNKISSAMAYPILMTLFGSLVLFFLLTRIVPTITGIFADMNQVLPAPTRFLIATSAFLKSYAWVLLILAVILAVAYLFIRKTVKGRHGIDRFKIVFPLVGPLLKKLAVARFSRTTGSLLENGVPMLSALGIVSNITGNVLISEAIESASKDVSKGQPLAESLDKNNIFPGLSIQMIQIGEQSGQLEEMLYKVADVYENEVETSVMRMTSLLEPVMIMIMGVVIGFIVLSVCLPIFEMNQLVM